ncbi:uncharacterized protein BDW70DRAFT_128026 [Aspergillus foveolatus]|uniref:uncharacterized protein n=1 Tax=Aspergillus foveolatus TaxID=210207 RepID=UPI003CCCC5BF
MSRRHRRLLVPCMFAMHTHAHALLGSMQKRRMHAMLSRRLRCLCNIDGPFASIPHCGSRQGQGPGVRVMVPWCRHSRRDILYAV